MVIRILDMYCGGGGASMGIHQALEEANIEHTIVGVDIRDMPDYPFIFVQKDVFDLKLKFIKSFDLTTASCPCQKYSSLNNMNRVLGRTSDWCDLIPPTRELLLKTKKPFVLENVNQSPLRKDLVLCGTMFNLGVFRHRIFEIHGFVCYQPHHPKHNGIIGDGKYFQITRGPAFVRLRDRLKKNPHYRRGTFEEWKKAMGVEWLSIPKTKELPKGHPLAEAIPPAYTKYIFSQYLKNYPSLMNFVMES